MFQGLTRMFGRVSAPSGPAVAPAPEENRAWARHRSEARATCRPAGARGAARVAVTLRDFSAVGLSLRSPRKFDGGTLLSVDLPGISVLARVVRAAPEPEGGWVLGCTFVDELGDEDLQAFGAEQQRPAEADNRAWVRFPCEAPVAYRSITGDPTEQGQARLANISPRGLALLADRPIEVGKILEVTPLDGEPGREVTVLACVLHVVPRGPGAWSWGCVSIRELGEEEFEALTEGP